MSIVDRRPVRIVEIDVDYCTLQFGVGACTASLSLPGVPRKCYNTFNTCPVKELFNPAPLTLRFVEPRSDLPIVDNRTYPVLNNVSPVTATVNIAGTSDNFNGLGRRGTITATFTDFPDNDRGVDKYASERRSGAAQLDESGYNPKDRGTFFGKLKSRWPQYGDRPMRYIEGYIDDNGDLQTLSTRHYIITDFNGPDRSGNVTIEGKDILHLADDKKALCPKPSLGQMRFEIFDRFDREGQPNPDYNPVVELTPEGIGDAAYPSSGLAALGREIVSFTRDGDNITLTGRGLEGTEERSHREGTTVQIVKEVRNVRIDDLVEDLLVNFANIDPAFIPKSEWQEDVTRWASTMFLDTIIARPEGVQTLISELAVLGVSVWWDDVKQEIGLKINSPVFDSDITDFNDDAHILDIEQEDNDEDRLTQIHFYSVQTDPTGSPTDKNNYDRIIVAIDAEAEQQNSYRFPRVREVTCRWVNRGADSILLINALRLLSRFNTAPKTYKVKIDNKDNSISLADVVRLNTRVAQDSTGKPVQRLTQVRQKNTRREHGWTDIVLQDFQFDGNFRLIAPNNTPVYGNATQEQKDTFAFMIAESEDFFPDGAPSHQLI